MNSQKLCEVIFATLEEKVKTHCHSPVLVFVPSDYAKADILTRLREMVDEPCNDWKFSNAFNHDLTICTIEDFSEGVLRQHGNHLPEFETVTPQFTVVHDETGVTPAYSNSLLVVNAIHYKAMPVYCYRLLRDKEVIRNHYKRIYKHVLTLGVIPYSVPSDYILKEVFENVKEI